MKTTVQLALLATVSSKMGENPLAMLPDQMGAADFFCIFTDANVGLDSEGSILQINIVCPNKKWYYK